MQDELRKCVIVLLRAETSRSRLRTLKQNTLLPIQAVARKFELSEKYFESLLGDQNGGVMPV